MPPITQGQIEFYEDQKLIGWYNEDSGVGGDEPLKDKNGEEIEPAMQFHEFLFMLGLIAKRCITSNNDIKQQLQEFYVENLEFERVNIDSLQDLTYQDVLDRAIDELEEGSGDEEGEWEYSEEEEDVFLSDPRQKALMALQERKFAEEHEIPIDWNGLQAEIEKCPMIPQTPVVE